MARRFFWNDGDSEYGESHSRMYVEGGCVVLEIEDWDGEDQRRYDYEVSVPVAAYRRVWRELRQGSGGKVKGKDGGSLTLARKGDRVEMVLSGTPSPGNTPGGSSLSGSVNIGWRFEGMALTEDELVGPDEPLAGVFSTLSVLVVLGSMDKIRVSEFREATVGLDPTELLELVSLFQDTELLLAEAGQAAADRWFKVVKNGMAFSCVSDLLQLDIRELEFKLATPGLEEVIGRIRAMVARLQSLASARAEELGSLVERVGRTRIYYKPNGEEAAVTFLGTGDCCWRSGKRVFRVQPSGGSFAWELIDYEDNIAEMIGSVDDEHERCFGDNAFLFTRACEAWLKGSTAILRKNISS